MMYSLFFDLRFFGFFHWRKLILVQLIRSPKFGWSQVFMYFVKVAVKGRTERFAHLTFVYNIESSGIVIPVESNACKSAKEWMLSSFPWAKQYWIKLHEGTQWPVHVLWKWLLFNTPGKFTESLHSCSVLTDIFFLLLVEVFEPRSVELKYPSLSPTRRWIIVLYIPQKVNN